MQIEAAHMLEAALYCAASQVLHRGSKELNNSNARKSAGVFCRFSFYAKDKKIKSAAYNAVILLSRTLSRFR